MCVSYHSSLLSGGLILPIRHPELHSLVLKESWVEARGDGGILSAPSGGRMQQHNLQKNLLPQMKVQYSVFVWGGHPA